MTHLPTQSRSPRRPIIPGAWRILFLAPMLALVVGYGAGCEEQDPQYGVENALELKARPQVWAIAPAINLSGQKNIDPLLEADLVYVQTQQVYGLTVIPVDRVVEVYTALHIEKVQTPEDAAAVCDALGCDGLLVPTVMLFDPYDPPKLGASLQLFVRHRGQLTGGDTSGGPVQFVQSVGEFDAANGSVRDAINRYAAGRSDPTGPLGTREYIVDMDRYCSFAYHSLLHDLLNQVAEPGRRNDRRTDETADDSNRHDRSGA